MCATDTITLTSSPFTRYLWSTGDTTRSIRTNASGPYTVTAISNNGCFISSDTINVYLSLPFEMSLQSHPFPNGFDLSAFGSNDGHVTVVLDGAASPYEVDWEGVHSSQIEYENLAAATYHVSVTDAAGCFASDSITLTQPAFVPPLPVDSTLQIPNGFTPNGDGFNDLFRILGLTQKYRVNTFRVWDISRALVFSAENYSNNWDGRDSKGNKLPAGTYYGVFESPELAEPASFFIDLRYE
jgi:gliding motility-associated-like protein